VSLLEVCDLTVALKKNDKIINAVNNISFSIEEGEIVALAGETGCGKTLAALSIAGLLPQKANIVSGDIIFNNRQLTSLSEKDLCGIRGKEISMIFQEVRQSLNPLLKVGRQIMETLELQGSMNKAQNKLKVLEILDSLGFEKPEKIFFAYPHQLSGGMCQRIVAAIASIGCPRLLLADEPSSALDADSQERILSLLTKMNLDYKMSVLIISHDLSVISKFAGRFLVMYAGRIVEEGPGNTLFSPLHPYTQALVNAIPDKNKRGKELENIPGKVPSVEDSLTGCPFAPRCKKAQGICFESFPHANYLEKGKVYCHYPLNGENHG